MAKNEIQKIDNSGQIVELNISCRPIDDELNQTISVQKNQDVKEFLAQIGNLFEIGRNSDKIINPKMEYVVKFKPELLKRMAEHDVRFLEDKETGDLLPDLYDYTDKAIGGKVRLEIKGRPTSQDITNLNIAINNLVQQQRYEELAEKIQKIQVTCERIERGQDNDRFAKVIAGKKHLRDALNYQGSEEDRRKMMWDALALLREGRELVQKMLLDKLEMLEDVPENKIKRFWRCFKNPEYFDEQTGQYFDIQEYFNYYYMAMQPMAYIYIMCEQSKLLETMIEDSRSVLKHRNIHSLATIEYLLPNDNFEDMWYKDSENIENLLTESYKPINNEKDLYIVVKGKDLLEVAGNER